MVWSKTQEVLSNPNIILRDLAETSDEANLDSLDNEIKELEKALHNYEQRRSNLLEAMELGEFEKDEILERLNSIKRLRHEDDAKLNDLLKTREHLTSLANAKVKLSELYERVLVNLQHSTPEIKALALDALDIKVYARGTDDVEIQGVITLELPTTARTSACLPFHAYSAIGQNTAAPTPIRIADDASSVFSLKLTRRSQTGGND